MKRYLLDSGIIGDFINRRRNVDTQVRKARHEGARIGTAFPVIGELFGGVELSSTRDRNLQKLKAALTGLICWPFDRTAAEEYGRIYADLRRRGRAIQVVDIQIAAIALTLGSTTIVSGDSDFDAVPGLMVEN